MLEQGEFDKLASANAFAIYNGIRTRQTGDGMGEAFLEVGPDNLNPYGVLHGGASAGAACRTDGRKYVTRHGSLDFIRSAEPGRVTARAQVKHRGRTTCLVSVEITGEDHTVYASGHYTFFCLGQLPAPG